jgi:diguanylate cyclase (GGDEF)-like protein/PAS domain S-box-containing protein
MRMPPRHAVVIACGAAATGVGLFLLGFSPWSGEAQSSATAGWLALVATVSLGAVLDPRRPGPEDQATMRLSFVSDLGALLLFGPLTMTLVATIGALTRALTGAPRSQPIRRTALDVAAAVAAAQAAAFAYAALRGTPAPFAWPWAGVPVAAAVVVYSLITCTVADLIVPLATGVLATRSWPRQALRGCPSHFIAAGICVALVEAIAHRAWAVLPVVALPLYFTWRAYIAHADRFARHHRRLDGTAESDHGVCVVDDNGRITHWNNALARLLDCPRKRAAGHPLAIAMPALAKSELPAAIHDSLIDRRPRTLPHVRLTLFPSPQPPVPSPQPQAPRRQPSAADARVLNVTILPDADGLMLLWHDVTEQVRAEQTLRQSAERFALVAEGANDGLWELIERTQTLYVSARWRAMVGLPAIEGMMQAEEWYDRVHADDLAGMKKALTARASGEATHIEHEHRIRHEDGTWRNVLCRGIAVRDANGRTVRLAGSLTDITDSAVARERILSAGFCDSLTGLGNRAAFMESLGQRLNDFKHRGGARFAALYLDLDRFKVVNDSLGHLVGDELLVAVSRRLEVCLRPGDAIARLGGDEFAVLLHGLGDEMQANVVAFRIQKALSKPFSIGGREVVTSASIGIAFSRNDYTTPDEIMRDADTAMYHAKGHGKARHELFDAAMHARAIDRLGLETDLRDAVQRNDFEVHYQPIVSLTSRMCTGFEALVRWKRNGKAVSPADFIPLAEELGLIEQLGAWVLQEACGNFATWQRQYPDCALDCITVNVSMRQLVQQGFMYQVEQIVESTGMRPCDLRLEITETALMDAPQRTAQVLQELRDFGVKIYLDDFGTGYSSLSHLHKLPVDALKIDRSFVRGLLLEDRPAIVESILALAKTLQTDVVAEGVEDEMQARKLERLGCRRAQGFYFSKPIPAVAVEALLAAHQPLGAKPEPRAETVVTIRKELLPFTPTEHVNRPAHAGMRTRAL